VECRVAKRISAVALIMDSYTATVLCNCVLLRFVTKLLIGPLMYAATLKVQKYELFRWSPNVWVRSTVINK